jgi:tetratricopeptide (TPR) repeat protein
LTRRLIYLLLAAFIVASCSTRQDKWLNRTWHSVNTRYNGYFNGNEAIKEGIVNLSKAHKDDFNRVIGVYRYGDKDIAQSVNPQTDRAIAKGVAMIKKHSMLINGKQRNKWIDDCYFLIGKANYLKREFGQTQQQLRYVIQTSEKQSVKDLAHVWMVKSYLDEGEFSQAEAELNNIAQKDLSGESKLEFQLALADFFIRQKDYAPAIVPLTEAIKLTKKKRVRARYVFIMGQIYRYLNRCGEAGRFFRQTIKLRPEYELEFQAAINLALCSDSESKNMELKRTLKQMTKDDKNIDYLDQIYYALAIISEKEKDDKAAVQYYNQSIRNSTTNNNQKGLSYLALAQYYFKNNNFVYAQKYYDSTVTNLKKDHPEYDQIVNLKENLGEIVKHIKVINEQDSIQALSALPEKERRKKIEDMIDKMRDEDEKKKLAENNPANSILNQNKAVNLADADPAVGKFYFENKQTVALGIADFKKNWGDRKLEDNWRRKNKSNSGPVSFDSPPAGTGTDDKKDEELEKTRYNPDTYLKGLPLSDSALLASNDQILDALFALGTLYKQNLKNYTEAARSFEKLIERSKDNKHVPLTYYHLYILYKLLNDEQASEKNKNIILNDYPVSEYAEIILNPRFMQMKQSDNKQAEGIYKQAFAAYKSNMYDKALGLCETAITSYPTATAVPRCALLKAICTGALNGKDMYIQELRMVSKNYPGHEVQKEADRILGLLATSQNAPGLPADNANAGAGFTVDFADKHFFILLIPDPAFEMNKLKNNFSDFNKEFYSSSELSVVGTVLDADNQILVVKEFANRDQALTYLKSVDNNADFIDKIETEATPISFVISYKNFGLLMKDRKVAEYLKFFYTNYKF